MSYDINAHRQQARNRFERLVREGGPGWHDYAKGAARDLAKEDPGLHGELPEFVRQVIQSEKPQ